MSQCSPKLPLQNADSLTVVDGGEKEKAKIPSLTVHGVKKKPLKITSKVDLKYKWEKPNCNKQKKQKKNKMLHKGTIRTVWKASVTWQLA